MSVLETVVPVHCNWASSVEPDLPVALPSTSREFKNRGTL